MKALLASGELNKLKLNNSVSDNGSFDYTHLEMSGNFCFAQKELKKRETRLAAAEKFGTKIEMVEHLFASCSYELKTEFLDFLPPSGDKRRMRRSGGSDTWIHSVYVHQ